MKTPQKIVIITFIVLFIMSLISCVSIKKDNGKHKGWFKNEKNPHHPAHTKTNGNGKGKSNK